MATFKKILKWTGIVVLVLAAIAVTLYMIYLRPFMQKMKVVNTVNFDKNLTLVLGGGGNSALLSSDSLLVVIDTKMDDAAKDLYEKAKQMAGNKPILVINTHIHPDHTGGNKFYKGATIIAGGNYTKKQWLKEAGEASMPTEWLKDRKNIPAGDDTLTIFNLGRNVHTESDIVVYLHKRKMLFGGDVILNKQNAIIMGNGRAEGFLWAFNKLPQEFDIRYVVPGHGLNGGKEVLDNFRSYFTDMKLAATDGSQKEALVIKYSDWNSIPFVMSPGATIRAFKKEMKK